MLKKNIKIQELNNNQQIITKQITSFESLTLNNIVITSRSEDNYINATQLCQAGDKQFNDWFRLNNITQGSWISPKFAIQVSKWIRQLLTGW